MRTILGLSALALAAAPGWSQPYYAPPPGSYQRQCTDIQMNGQFLSAYCRGSRGAGRSSINIVSCSTGIFVDPSGALTCIGPGAGAPPDVRNAPPGYATGERPGYGPVPYHGGRGRTWASLYARPGWRGEALRIAGPTPDLHTTGLNDRVRSIRLEGRPEPWIVCTDAGFRGRCVTIDRSIADTRELGMRDAISSLRPER